MKGMERPLIMIVGLGDLATHVLHMLLSDRRTNRIVVAGRDVETIRRRANLALFTAANLGLDGEVTAVRVDLDDVDATAGTIAGLKPDIIFNGASLQSWRIITELPKAAFEALDEAQFGPWLPMHLVPVRNLMEAVRRSGCRPKVVNAAFPDAVNPVLAKIGLAPDIGIGNVANIIPALRFAVAHVMRAPVERIELRLVAQHYFSHYVPRFGTEGNAPYHLSARLDGTELNGELDRSAAFGLLATRFKRLGGVEGQVLTAASATRVLRAMAGDTNEAMHAPGPGGLPGGYPVRVGAAGGTLDLPEGLTPEEAVRINEACQRADGIEAIEADGTVRFTEREMGIMRSLLGYECRAMRIDDAASWAEELGRRYRAFAAAA